MRYLVAERKIGWTLLLFAFGICLFVQASVFARPVYLSEKGLLLLFAGMGLLAGSVLVAVRSVQKV